jgi:DNA-binding IclR family transcriptional regulator
MTISRGTVVWDGMAAGRGGTGRSCRHSLLTTRLQRPEGAPMSLTSLQRGLEMLTKVTRLGPTRVDEIATALNMPISTAYRYVKLFKEADFLYEIDGVYSAGPMISSRDEQTQKQHIVEMAAPTMTRLRQSTNETVILTVRVQAAALCLERLPAGRTSMLSFYRGSVRPLYAGASATALMHMPRPMSLPPCARAPCADSPL